MFIKKGKKTKEVNNLLALYKDCKSIERVSKFGAFILCFILGKQLKVKLSPEIKRIYLAMISGYNIPKGFSLRWDKSKSKGKNVNLKEFVDSVYKKYSK